MYRKSQWDNCSWEANKNKTNMNVQVKHHAIVPERHIPK